MSDLILPGGGFQHTAAPNTNGYFYVRQFDGLVPCMPLPGTYYTANTVSFNVNRYGALGLAGAVIQMGDNANPTTPSKLRITAFGRDFGLIYDTSPGFTNPSNATGLLPVGMTVRGRGYEIPRGIQYASSVLPFGQSKNAAAFVVRDITDGTRPYVVQFTAAGDRNNTIQNRFWIYAFLMSPLCAQMYGQRLAWETVAPVASTSAVSINSWLSASALYNITQMDVYNTSGSTCNFSLIPDGTNTTNFYAIPAGGMQSVTFMGGGAVQSFSTLKVQQSVASALRYTVYSAQGG